jgi:Cft2 family RNA processing exonuclease
VVCLASKPCAYKWVFLQDIVSEPDEIPSMKTGAPIPRKCSVDDISFSAHVDYSQNADFIEQVKPKHIVSVLIIANFCFLLLG